MKILRIITTMDPKNGGPCQGIRNIIPAMKQLGIENEVLSFDDEESDFLRYDNFVIHALGLPKSPWAYNSNLVPWLKKNITNYDTIIIHGLWLYHSYATVKVLLKQIKISVTPPVYIIPHGMLDPWFQRDKSRRFKALRNEIYWYLIESKVVNCADGILFTCEQELFLAKQTFKKYKPRREINVGYGIETPPLFSLQMKESFHCRVKFLFNRPYILFLSRIHPKKSIDLLIDTYLKLEDKNVELPDLVIAGSTEDKFAVSMLDKASRSNKIHFTGMLTGDAKWGALYCCEAFILPSHQENFGIAVVEALACGKPVLISDQVNIWKEIIDGEAGLVESDTSQGIEKLLTNWIDLKSETKESMSVRAQEVYFKHFAVEQAAKNLKKVLMSEIQYA